MNIDIMGLVLLLCGLYIIYAAVILKKDGIVTRSIMASKAKDPDRMRDREGFASYIFPRALGLGVVCCLESVWEIFLAPKGSPFTQISPFLLLLVFLAVIVYISAIRKAEKMFY